MLLLGYQCLQLENARPLERSRVLNEIRGRDGAISPDRFDDLWNVFQNARRRIVTQHIIAETYGLRRRLARFRHRKDIVWRSALLLLDNPGIEEQSCVIRDLSETHEYKQILHEIGPADAGLIYSAEHNKATIVTDDGKLTHWAAVRSVPAVLLSQLGHRYW